VLFRLCEICTPSCCSCVSWGRLEVFFRLCEVCTPSCCSCVSWGRLEVLFRLCEVCTPSCCSCVSWGRLEVLFRLCEACYVEASQQTSLLEKARKGMNRNTSDVIQMASMMDWGNVMRGARSYLMYLKLGLWWMKLGYVEGILSLSIHRSVS